MEQLKITVKPRLEFSLKKCGDTIGIQGPKGDKGDTSILEFEVDDEMNLIQYSTSGYDLDFDITSEGILTLTF